MGKRWDSEWKPKGVVRMNEKHYLYVVRYGKEIVALFPNKQRAIYYCQEQLPNLHYQKEVWERFGDKKVIDRLNELETEYDNCKQNYKSLFTHHVCLQEENEILRKERDYWKKKFDEGVETLELLYDV